MGLKNYRTIVDDLYIKWGFCILDNEDYYKISKSKYYNAKGFAEDVLIAEGMNPEYELRWMRKISNKFKKRFGKDENRYLNFCE